MAKGSGDRYFQENAQKLVPEGVEGRVAYKGSLAETVFQMVEGLKHSMGYCGVANIRELQTQAKFIRITNASLKESHPHDIYITKESPTIARRYSVRLQYASVACGTADAGMAREPRTVVKNARRLW
jgi:hypothetical protein